GCAETRDLPTIIGVATVLVRPRQEEIPNSAERIDLELVILVIVAVRVDEDLEVVLMEDHGVVLAVRRPDVGLFELRADVEVLVVPEHLHAGEEPRLRLRVALDVDEGRGPGRGTPGRLLEPAVDRKWLRRPVADVTLRLDLSHSVPVGGGTDERQAREHHQHSGRRHGSIMRPVLLLSTAGATGVAGRSVSSFVACASLVAGTFAGVLSSHLTEIRGSPGGDLTYEEFMACGDRERREIFNRLTSEERSTLVRTPLERAAAAYGTILSEAQLAVIRQAIELVTPELYRGASDASGRARADQLAQRIRALFDGGTARQVFTLEGAALPEVT